MKPIVILNGPPSSGKDTIAGLLTYRGFIVQNFKQRMHEIACTMLGWTMSDWLRFYNDRSMKEIKHDFLGDKSTREFMIHISESVIKPLFGKDYFGTAAAQSVKNVLSDHGYKLGAVFADGGFPEEIPPLGAVGKILIVRLHRSGCSFLGDSRNYLTEDDLPMCKFMDEVIIDGEPEAAVNHIMQTLVAYELL